MGDTNCDEVEEAIDDDEMDDNEDEDERLVVEFEVETTGSGGEGV